MSLYSIYSTENEDIIANEVGNKIGNFILDKLKAPMWEIEVDSGKKIDPLYDNVYFLTITKSGLDFYIIFKCRLGFEFKLTIKNSDHGKYRNLNLLKNDFIFETTKLEQLFIILEQKINDLKLAKIKYRNNQFNNTNIKDNIIQEVKIPTIEKKETKNSTKSENLVIQKKEAPVKVVVESSKNEVKEAIVQEKKLPLRDSKGRFISIKSIKQERNTEEPAMKKTPEKKTKQLRDAHGHFMKATTTKTTSKPKQLRDAHGHFMKAITTKTQVKKVEKKETHIPGQFCKQRLQKWTETKETKSTQSKSKPTELLVVSVFRDSQGRFASPSTTPKKELRETKFNAKRDHRTGRYTDVPIKQWTKLLNKKEKKLNQKRK